MAGFLKFMVAETTVRREAIRDADDLVFDDPSG